ncbi:MAG: SRPBCC family protein [Bacteroidales bacterium]|nr:SRPBCC family protein [Bacteroidales bacterium]
MKLESKIGKIENSDERIFNFLSDFENIKKLVPEDKVENWESGEDWCTFSVNPVGKTGVKIVEKEEFKLLKFTSIEESQYNFFFWLQLKQVSENDTRVKLTLDVNLNAMVQMMAKKPLKEFLDKLVDQLATLPY